jgi:transporter family protein
MPALPLVSWQLWAGLAALFAALTGVHSKIGLSGIDPDLATLLRTSVVRVALFGVLVLGERLTLHGWLGIVLMGLGAVLLAWP